MSGFPAIQGRGKEEKKEKQNERSDRKERAKGKMDRVGCELYKLTMFEGEERGAKREMLRSIQVEKRHRERGERVK